MGDQDDARPAQSADVEKATTSLPKWSLGILNDRETIRVPGSVILFSDKNEPLGLNQTPARQSHSSLPTGLPVDTKKRTQDGRVILDPQPEDSENDPLNWSTLRRDLALLSLGLYCMVGGGVTTLLAAGFTDIAEEYDVGVETVSLTTGLYMAGLGIGGIILTPTAILYGKRPVYLASAVAFILTSVWCALSPTFGSLVAARIFQGISVSSVECLPSATIAEIFFLHERAFRIGIYTLLLLGGKNLTPLVSAAIMNRWEWRWVFWILAIIVAVCWVLLFLFVPETFWERALISRSHRPSRRPSFSRPSFSRRASSKRGNLPKLPVQPPSALEPTSPKQENESGPTDKSLSDSASEKNARGTLAASRSESAHVEFATFPEPTSPRPAPEIRAADSVASPMSPSHPDLSPDIPQTTNFESIDDAKLTRQATYTQSLRYQPARSFAEQLRPYHGRLNQDTWFKVMYRPFILFAYPAILWSALTYACSIGWLIVISESVAIIYRDPTPYNFTALQTGLVYISPFIGGVLGTGVAGRLSDVIVQAMARRNGGMYEPEFRLIMVAPILITTCVGLMGFGWSAEAHNSWIVPTVFFGIVSFGCSLGSTTAVTYCVDSYRQYAGEALVTLNFAKNICHGLVFSFFFAHWLVDDGAKSVFIWVGIIQLICTLTAIPMYIYGKRARMWTVRKNLVERF